MIDLSGISIPIATPFRDEHLDLECLRENLAHWKKFDLCAFVLLGSTGEGVALSDREKRHFVATATGFVAGYRPVI
ncbi:MAG: dihydrodipicolinate synthase family protein, partial [Calditrichia bacterium]